MTKPPLTRCYPAEVWVGRCRHFVFVQCLFLLSDTQGMGVSNSWHTAGNGSGTAFMKIFQACRSTARTCIQLFSGACDGVVPRDEHIYFVPCTDICP